MQGPFKTRALKVTLWEIIKVARVLLDFLKKDVKQNKVHLLEPSIKFNNMLS